MLIPPVAQPENPSAPPKPVRDARLLLWIQAAVNAISLALAVTLYFPDAAEQSDADLRLMMNLLGVFAVVLLGLMVLSAALIVKRLAWVYVVALALQALSLAVIVLAFEPRQLLSLFLAGYIGLLLLRPESRRWFFPRRTG